MRFAFNSLRFSALAIAAIASTTAQADDSMFKFSGYGTLAATFTDSDSHVFRSSLSQAKGAGTAPDLGVDSKFGVQGVATFGQGWTAVGQLLLQRRRTDEAALSDNDVSLGLEWLFAQYSPTSNLDLRLGRVVLPAFMLSDSRNVGYAQPWMRAPLDVYGHMPLTNLTGAQVVWRVPVSDVMFTIQPTYGNCQANTFLNGVSSSGQKSDVVALNVSAEVGDWTVRAGQVRSSVPFSMALLAQMGDPTPISYDMKDVFTTVGLQYDNGQAVLISEWAKRKQNGLPASADNLSVMSQFIYSSYFAGKPLAAETAWYVGAGWRMGKALPMLTYGHFKNSSAFQPDSWNSLNFSLRYDVMDRVALKAQIGRYKANDNTAFAYTTSGDHQKVMTYAAGLDFVF
jgi:hypothetical protein